MEGVEKQNTRQTGGGVQSGRLAELAQFRGPPLLYPPTLKLSLPYLFRRPVPSSHRIVETEAQNSRLFVGLVEQPNSQSPRPDLFESGQK